MNQELLKNYLTTLFGVLAGLPTIVLGSGVALDAKWSHYLMITAGVGTIGLGVVAKAFNVHSTSAQVQTSPIENPGIQAAAVVQAKVAAIEAPQGGVKP